MATVTSSDVLVMPPLPEDMPADDVCKTVDSLSDLIRVEIQTVGKWFEQYSHRRLLSVPFAPTADDDGGKSKNDSDDDNSDDGNDDGSSADTYVNILGEWKDQDHYALLGLQDKRWQATQDDIKRAYRKMVLKHHPDKKGDLPPAEMKKADEYFSRIQKAYELLCNEQMRRLYDSVDDFDDDIPDILPPKERKDFIEVFAPVFEHNAKFVVEKPVPSLGTMDTPYKKVVAFYEFWNTCTSWREFGYNDDEYNLDDAECREEKRWMERQNKNARKRKKKAEIARLRKLVSNAQACDPRIKRELARQRKEKEDAKRLREERKKQAAEERRQKRLEEEEQRKKEKEEARANEKKAKEQAKKLRRAITKACKRAGIYDPENPSVTPKVGGKRVVTGAEMETLKSLEADEIKALTSISEDAAFKKAVFAQLQKLNGGEGDDDDDDEQEQEQEEEEGPKPWSDDEQKVLETAIRSVPKSDPDRWDKIAELVPGRTKKECVERIKECMAKVKQAKSEPPAQWTEEEEVVLTKAASKVYPPGTTTHC
ncbi:hypothetical protein PTSG_05570 [Salpingoeca rosetta]|uniref:DnaJ homolog subfamily C member 2 n=1 Tax=Salpingoeca rosetta (strain ATCC 50818 / BSB-021) TaxID=946362 RepID=F2UBK9_SALR5|nr:uncharacterized protein PTSG_05570 [Salpingoeca rosetta]EGD73875.1 hypothetical protein PTSG_05570 [Salpingoeca rosetta]|eukprot:XP_004993438.1 hypothetical protein PTSG_05570 [Salpingoeca rosetta]